MAKTKKSKKTMESFVAEGYFPIKTLRNWDILMVQREEMEIDHYSHPQCRRVDVLIASPDGKGGHSFDSWRAPSIDCTTDGERYGDKLTHPYYYQISWCSGGGDSDEVLRHIEIIQALHAWVEWKNTENVIEFNEKKAEWKAEQKRLAKIVHEEAELERIEQSKRTLADVQGHAVGVELQAGDVVMISTYEMRRSWESYSLYKAYQRTLYGVSKDGTGASYLSRYSNSKTELTKMGRDFAAKNGGRFVYVDYSPESKTPEVTVKRVRVTS